MTERNPDRTAKVMPSQCERAPLWSFPVDEQEVSNQAYSRNYNAMVPASWGFALAVEFSSEVWSVIPERSDIGGNRLVV